jgi:PAS domain S-box-containing protein
MDLDISRELLLRTEERLAFLLRLSDALRPLRDPIEVQEVASRLLGEHLRVNRVGYAELENREYVVRREYARGVAPLAGQGPVGGFAEALRDEFRSGEPVVVNDVDTDPRFTESERLAMRPRQIAAFVGVLLLKGGQLVAAFGANNATPRSWTPTEIALIRDVGERTWDAVELARAEAALREREQRLRLALDASAGGSWTWEAGSNRLDWDDGFRARYGFAHDEPPAQDAWMSRVHEDDRPQVLGVLDEVLNGKDAWDNTFRIVLPGGRVSWIHSLGRADRAADGQVTRLTGLDLDVTARREADEALRARRDDERDRARTVELEHRTAQLSRLASDLTLAEQHAREQLAKTLHDGLQQLLVSAALNIDRHLMREAQRGTAPDEPLARAKGYLDEAIASARSLSLELFPPQLHGSGLPAALTWLAERTRNQYGLVVEVSADPLANSDRKDVRTLLFESVRELLFNAVKHAHVDRVTIDLSVDQDDALCIIVADRGIGFDPAALVKQANDGESGWGLFSIRERLTLLGGRFDIASTPGQGTRFRLVAPRSETQGGVDTQRRPSRVGTGSPLHNAAGLASARALRILLVDDHAGVRRMFRELLDERPELCVVGEAGDGLGAVANAHGLRPDVILMDVSMPAMDGVEATRRIRAELPSIQILGLSTHLKSDDLHAIEEAGAADYFTKGVDTQRLIDHLMAVHAAVTIGLPRRQA